RAAPRWDGKGSWRRPSNPWRRRGRRESLPKMSFRLRRTRMSAAARRHDRTSSAPPGYRTPENVPSRDRGDADRQRRERREVASLGLTSSFAITRASFQFNPEHFVPLTEILEDEGAPKVKADASSLRQEFLYAPIRTRES